MAHLDDLLDEWEKDCKLDKTELGAELLRIPQLHTKYLKLLTKYRLIAKKLVDDIKVERKTRYCYYSGHYNTDKAMLDSLGLDPFKLVLKQDINLYIDSDPAIMSLNAKKAYYDELVAACEAIMNELKSRTFQLRDAISWEKFVQGA